MDLITLALARKFTKDTVNGLGAIKGAPCTIKSIVEEGSFTTITFGWIGNDGTEETSEVKIPYSNGISNIEITEDGSLIFSMNDGTTINAGTQSTKHECNIEVCKCVDARLASDDDIEPLLEEIGLYDVADYALLDEQNNPLTDSFDEKLVE